MSKTVAEQAKERDDHTCQKCGRELTKTRLEAHHIHPKWAGGADKLGNIITLCKQCHRFAPMRSDPEEAINATEIFLSSVLPPALDLFLCGAEWALLIDDATVGDLDGAMAQFENIFRRMMNDPERDFPKRQSSWYFILRATLAQQRVSSAPERVEMKFAKNWLEEKA